LQNRTGSLFIFQFISEWTFCSYGLLTKHGSVGVQYPISSSQSEVPSYWDWLWCPGLSPVLVSIVLPFAFHIWCFPFALTCHWISIVSRLYGQRIATHSVDPSLTNFLGEFPGLGLALVPDVVVPEAYIRKFHMHHWQVL